MDGTKETPSPEIHSVAGEAWSSYPAQKTDRGITLIPPPSDNPRDPLNWPMSKKLLIVAALCLSTFAGFAGSLCGQLAPGPQSKLYHEPTVKIAYQTSLGNAGMVLGGFVFFPLAHKIGRSSAIFWSLVGLLLCNLWGGLMTGSGDYWRWLGSRFMSGFFGTVTGVLGPRVLVDLFFLHQRGRAFTVFHYCFDFGTVAGPTLGAFIIAAGSWTNAYWWSVGLAGLSLVVCFIFLHETSWDRSTGIGAEAENKSVPEGFVANRIATFFPGTRLAPYSSWQDVVKAAGRPFIVAATPITIFLSLFTLVSFGFYVAMNAITPVWLQKPEKAGGYGFTTQQNALFSFAHWVGVTLALAYGQLVSDRLPLWICARNGGIWKPEYRLHALWLPALVCNPLGLGLFGAALQYHWSWGVLALGQVLVTFGSLTITPVTVNYACEVFTKNPAETAIVLNAFRLGFGLSVTFYINEWVALMAFRWTYGMMAFLQLLSFCFIVLLMWKGHGIRQWRIRGLGDSEEGERLVGKRD